MDRTAFFAALRSRDSGVFGTSLSQSQVYGVEAVLDECEALSADLGQTAYVLATGYGETGGKMQPRRENMNYSAKRIREVWPNRFASVAAARPYARNPRALANKVYNGRMGNRPGTDDGWIFRGNGLGQITGRYNHEAWGKRLGLDLLGNPSLMDDLRVSVSALVRPMLEGWATGKKLSTFVSGSRRDYLGARVVWGGVDAPKYAAYAKSFEAALEAAGYGEDAPPLVDHVPAPPAPSGGFWAALVAMLSRVFKGA